MIIDISSVRKSEGSSLRIDSSFDLSELAPGFSDVKAEGEIRNISGIVSIKLTISGVYSSACDRCGNDTVLPLKTEIATVFDAGGTKDDSVVFTDSRIDLDRTVADALVLALPMQILCSEDCRPVTGEGYDIIFDED